MIIEVFTEINTMPILVLACRLCPKNIESTMYALIMAIINLGGSVSQLSGGLLMGYMGINDKNFDNLWILCLITNLFMLIPLPFLAFIDIKGAEEFAQQEKLDTTESNRNLYDR